MQTGIGIGCAGMRTEVILSRGIIAGIEVKRSGLQGANALDMTRPMRGAEEGPERGHRVEGAPETTAPETTAAGTGDPSGAMRRISSGIASGIIRGSGKASPSGGSSSHLRGGITHTAPAAVALHQPLSCPKRRWIARLHPIPGTLATPVDRMHTLGLYLLLSPSSARFR